MRRWRDRILQAEETTRRRNVSARRRFNQALRAGRDALQADRDAYNDAYVPDTLSKRDRAIQTRALIRSQDAYEKGKYVDRPRVNSFRSRGSPHVRRAKKMHGIKSMADLDGLARSTGCSKASLKKIIRKGKGAFYSSGSRPNQTPDSWAYARLASATTGGKAAKVDYHELKDGGCNEEILQMALKAGEDDEFPWLTYENAAEYLDEAAQLGVSEVARGPGGFMDVYRRERRPSRMRRTVHGRSGQTWGRRRRNFIKRHLAQYLKNPTRRRWLAMVMWGFKA